jgi:haloacetate dehalogenase
VGSRTHRMARVNGIRLHFVVQGSGPALVLLHGWPQTWYEWRLLISPLAERYTVIAPDLRGYGLSDKPRGGFDKRSMASDVRELVRSLGHERITLVGHDRGARVAHRYGLDYPDEVERIAFLDIIPTRETFRRTDATLARGYWHWFFHLQPDLPELLVGPNVEAYLRYFFERWTYNRAAFEQETIAEYVRAFSAPGALRAGFDDYRASYPDDLAADGADAEAGRKLAMPVLVLWGAAGLINALPVLDIWREYATDVRGGPISECGHFLPEEQPEPVLARLREFLEESAS